MDKLNFDMKLYYNNNPNYNDHLESINESNELKDEISSFMNDSVLNF